ncbi:secreted frizzled-related protein 2-like [Latimeria chalumnae]|nr:PREDICTED: secreted frizzled-related protein 2-like [Latimeria chalumnae]|eukprot:XP_006003642.1 PREDICTED: secreted frizzled-related protein 2-like [Latimeria chalumnae]
MAHLTSFCVLLILWAIPSQMEAFPFVLSELSTRKNTCKAIPSTMTLCHGLGYNEMRLPNLLGHETIKETLQQANSWVPLLTKQCHLDTKKFLCSLFAPVCITDLEEAVYPCRSLCEAVRDGCAPVMAAFGFPWPQMFNCSRFPMGNGLCVPLAGSENKLPPTKEDRKTCIACQYNGDDVSAILDNFCRTEFALKMKVSDVSEQSGDLRVTPQSKSRAVYKHGGWSEEDLRRPVLWLAGGAECACEGLRDPSGDATFLVTGQKVDDRLVISLLWRWQKGQKEMKKMTRTLRKLQC